MTFQRQIGMSEAFCAHYSVSSMQLQTFVRPLQRVAYLHSARKFGVHQSLYQHLSRRNYIPWRTRSPRNTLWTDVCHRRKSFVALPTADSSPVVVLFFSNVPIEPTFSAAGVRSRYILTQLLQDPSVEAVHILSPLDVPAPTSVVSDAEMAMEKSDSNSSAAKKSFQYHTLWPNRTSDAMKLLQQICRPEECSKPVVLALFDRYYCEEMFSFHLHKVCPDNVVFVLDMQDMHSLRHKRHNWVLEQQPAVSLNDDDVLQRTIPVTEAVLPSLRDSMLLRELASIHRCDLTLVCSPFEYDLLVQRYQIPSDKLCVAPLFGGYERTTSPRSFAERKDFVFVGGTKHAPNVDAIRQLKRLWPAIRQQCRLRQMQTPPPSLYIYGAHCPPNLRSELHDPRQGFLMQGYFSSSIEEVLWDKRVLLSPLRFGAGIKGKHVDAWRCGVPVVTTSIGSEGMLLPEDTARDFGGRIAHTDLDFIHEAAALYNSESAWTEAVANITPQRLFALCSDWERIRTRMMDAVREKDARRSRDVFQNILWHQSNRSAEYFSKYIECKDEKKRSTSTSTGVSLDEVAIS